MKSAGSIALLILSACSGYSVASEEYSPVRLDSFQVVYRADIFQSPVIDRNHFSAGIPYYALPETFALDAKVMHSRQEFSSAEKFISFYKDIHAQRTRSDTRHDVITFGSKPQQIGAMTCVRYSMLLKDQRSVGSDKNMVMAEGIGCLHPDIKNKLIEVSYSVRNTNGNTAPHYKDIGERFLASVLHTE
jgi:hypothetical protein